MTSEESAKVTAIVVETWPVPAWTEQAIEAYAAGIEDLEIRLVAPLVRELVRSSDSRPSVAALRRRIAERRLERIGAPPEPEAWAKFVEWIGTVGRYRELPNTPALPARIARTLGWANVCNETKAGVLRAQFRDAYGKELERLVVSTTTADGCVPPQIEADPGRSLKGPRLKLPNLDGFLSLEGE